MSTNDNSYIPSLSDEYSMIDENFSIIQSNDPILNTSEPSTDNCNPDYSINTTTSFQKMLKEIEGKNFVPFDLKQGKIVYLPGLTHEQKLNLFKDLVKKSKQKNTETTETTSSEKKKDRKDRKDKKKDRKDYIMKKILGEMFRYFKARLNEIIQAKTEWVKCFTSFPYPFTGDVSSFQNKNKKGTTLEEMLTYIEPENQKKKQPKTPRIRGTKQNKLRLFLLKDLDKIDAEIDKFLNKTLFKMVEEFYNEYFSDFIIQNKENSSNVLKSKLNILDVFKYKLNTLDGFREALFGKF